MPAVFWLWIASLAGIWVKPGKDREILTAILMEEGCIPVWIDPNLVGGAGRVEARRDGGKDGAIAKDTKLHRAAKIVYMDGRVNRWEQEAGREGRGQDGEEQWVDVCMCVYMYQAPSAECMHPPCGMHTFTGGQQ